MSKQFRIMLTDDERQALIGFSQGNGFRLVEQGATTYLLTLDGIGEPLEPYRVTRNSSGKLEVHDAADFDWDRYEDES